MISLTEPSPREPGSTTQLLRVLLIEDDADDAELALGALRDIPWFRTDIAVSTTYARGLTALREGAYDIVLLDHRLGPRTGLELLREALGNAIHIPVVLLTGVVDHAMDLAATSAGVAYLLEKSELSPTRLERSIRYALERGGIERELRRTRAFFQAAFGSLADHVAIVDADGTILAVNQPWTRFASDNRFAAGRAGSGMNYLEVCDTAVGPSSEGAAAVARGIREVLHGVRPSFTCQYPCHAPDEERWFLLKVSRFEDDGQTRALIAHENITERRIAEIALRASEERHRLVASAMRELIWDLDLASARIVRSGATRTLLGDMPLDSSMDEWQARIHPEDRSSVRDSLTAALSGRGTLWQAEYRFRRPEGTYAHLSDHGYIVRDAQEKAVRVVGATADITERKEAELALRRSERRYRSLIDTAHEGICTLDAVGTITYVNRRLCELLGYGPAELAGRSLFDFVHPSHRFEARTRFARRYRGISDADEMQFQSSDGTSPWLLTSSSQMVDEQGQFVGVLVMLSDITSGKNAELAMAEALRAADLDRRRLEATLNAIPVGVWLADATGRLTHTNPAASEIWRGSAPHVDRVAEYAVYKAWSPITGEPLRPEEWALARTLASGCTITNDLVEIERFDTSRGFILSSSAPIPDAEGGVSGGVVVVLDVTDRQAEALEREQLVEALEVERSRLASLFEEAPSFLAVLRGPELVFERANPAYMRLVGPRDLLGKPLLEALPELRGQHLVDIVRRVFATGEPFVGRHLPAVIIPAPGAPPERRFVNVVYQRVADPGEEHAIVAHGWDATDEVLATEALRRNEQRLRDQFAKLPVPTLLWEARGDDFVLLDFNEAADSLLPRHPGGSRGRLGRELYPDMEDFWDEMRRVLRDGGVVRRTVAFDMGPPMSRRVLDVTIGAQPPNRVLVHSVDITERVALEEQLVQAQKMEAVGRLAGGVAHDFNNLLTVIGAHGAFLLESLDERDPRREDAELIIRTGERAAGLTRQLLAFSRKQILRPCILDLNATVTESLRMLDRLLGEDVRVVTELSSDLPPVLTDPGQVDQVVMNLAVNARDAMPRGGVLTVATRSAHIDVERPGAGHLIPAGAYVELSVRDTGVGMSAAVQARLFEPFFTTKEPGRGTGLGLATVYGIVQQSGGFLDVESVPGAGTTFRIFLPEAPSVAEPDPEPEPRSVAKRSRAAGVETILLVEDDPAVRDVARQMLQGEGYLVLEAGDGHVALEVSDTFASAIHLVISDTVMPGLDGAEAVRRLQAQRPEMKALFISGYTDDEVMRRGIVTSQLAFVPKPFTAEELTRAVRDALDS